MQRLCAEDEWRVRHGVRGHSVLRLLLRLLLLLLLLTEKPRIGWLVLGLRIHGLPPLSRADRVHVRRLERDRRRRPVNQD